MSGGSFYYPQKMGRALLAGMEEILSPNGMRHALKLGGLENMLQEQPVQKFPFESISALQTTLELIYGPHGGRGVALRAGRASFKYGLKEYGSMLGLTESAFRLLALPNKLHAGARAFAELFNKHTDQIVRVTEGENQIIWQIERCPLCWGRAAEEPICHLAVGLIQEALYWVSGGKVFNVEETECRAAGGATCKIVIDKTPLT
ncbi:MAG: 4-vinyl reductase [Anaerolineales bacterium]|nr:4-vinyl reductase [Anaerolineales bacterium]MCZ2122382.1 4-vinyl reductase [Anaerolineales bacterium]